MGCTFVGDYPARAFAGISKLTFGVRYEVMGIAIRRRHATNKRGLSNDSTAA